VISKCFKKEGESVEAGEDLFEVETGVSYNQKATGGAVSEATVVERPRLADHRSEPALPG